MRILHCAFDYNKYGVPLGVPLLVEDELPLEHHDAAEQPHGALGG